MNPARLHRDRQLEVCMQCHLETSSSLMPNEIRRYNRTIDSYRPGEPIGDYKIYFDRARRGRGDRVRDCARRLSPAHVRMLSLQPDDVPYLPRSSPGIPYFDIDGTLRGGLPGVPSIGRPSRRSLPAGTDCLSCHMPKRRTDDVVHVVMTDHYIQKREAGPRPVGANAGSGQ